ncbi:peptidoglycan hydrolase [Burkholderia ubonensis]|uniref:peptidoglycan hydrolase n=1 Tax=Burkholderia ubonensis TaxID=101571 RepID=UPI0012FAC75A|nr:peptidoglycan hydrolase [Burkholderia ubonensis]
MKMLADTRRVLTDEAWPKDAAPDPGEMKKLRAAAGQFEAMFIRQMLHGMNDVTRELAANDSPLRNPVAGDMLDYANMAFADSLASQRAFGISDFIVRQMASSLPHTRPGEEEKS